MATLIPSLSACVSRMTGGERRLAQRLEAKLESDYLLWYDVAIGQAVKHPDFIVLHPQRGLLILEVKDWKRDTIRSADKHSVEILTSSGIKHVSNPLEQARQYAKRSRMSFRKTPSSPSRQASLPDTCCFLGATGWCWPIFRGSSLRMGNSMK